MDLAELARGLECGLNCIIQSISATKATYTSTVVYKLAHSHLEV